VVWTSPGRDRPPVSQNRRLGAGRPFSHRIAHRSLKNPPGIATMNDRLAFRPDLIECALEVRILPAIEFGLTPNPFLQVNATTNQLIVPGTSTSSAGISAGGSIGSGSSGSNAPGPNWFFLMIGGNASGVSNGSRVGGSLSVFSITSLRVLPPGAMVRTISNIIAPIAGGGGGGGVADTSGNGTGNPGSTSNFGGFGASFSSGYGFALNSANNFGTSLGATNTLGSVPVHNYGGGGDMLDAPEFQDPTGGNSGNGPTPGEQGSPSTATPMPAGLDLQGPGSKLYENLLGKNPAQMGPQPIGPGTGMGQTYP
jgi:hypothetical protein